MRLRPLLPVALLAFLVLVGATASCPPAGRAPPTSPQVATSSVTTLSATSSSGRARSGYTRRLRNSTRRPRSRSA